MKRFTFKLDTMLELRKQEEEKVKLELAEKNREIIALQEELNLAYLSLKELQASEKERRSGSEPVMEMRYGVAYRYKLKNDILTTGRSIDDLRAESNTIQKRLMEAIKRRRALEVIRDRRYSAWKKNYLREEQKFIDDVAQQKYSRTKR
jgi:flagellar protein FliJ